MTPSNVNDGARALEGLVARWHKDTNASKASTGSANAYVFAADQTISAYYDGLVIGFDANFENTGAATLNVDAVSADTIKKHNDQDLVAGDIESGQKVVVLHDGTNWQMQTPTAMGGSPITTRGDITRGDTNGDAERLAIGSAGQAVVSDGTDVLWQSPTARGSIDGLILSNNALDAVNDIDIAPGVARDDANTTGLLVATAIGKRIDASWATGGTTAVPTGGLSSSLTLANDTWYHVILGIVSGAAEVGFDTSITGANLVTDHSFTNTRRIGSVRRGTATNLAFFQKKDLFLWDVPIQDYSDTTIAATLRTLMVPTGIEVEAYHAFHGSYNATTGLTSYGLITHPDQTATTPSITAFTWTLRTNVASSHSNSIVGFFPTDTSARIRTEVSSATAFSGMTGCTLGWRDFRGANA